MSAIAQVTDSAGNVSSYTSLMTGGIWYVSNSQGSGCSSCTMRGTTQQDYDALGNMLDTTDELWAQDELHLRQQQLPTLM